MRLFKIAIAAMGLLVVAPAQAQQQPPEKAVNPHETGAQGDEDIEKTFGAVLGDLFDNVSNISECDAIKEIQEITKNEFSTFDTDGRIVLGLLQNSAIKGASGAQAFLGLANLLGVYTTPNMREASRWLGKAAKYDYPPAQYMYGWMYKCGWGVTADAAAYQSWVQKAADNGYAQAQLEVGLWYMQGKIISRDEKKALEWIVKAAEQNNGEAQFYIAQAYMLGQGGEAKPEMAALWREMAIINNFQQAQMLQIPNEDTSSAQHQKLVEKAQACINNQYQNCIN